MAAPGISGASNPGTGAAIGDVATNATVEATRRPDEGLKQTARTIQNRKPLMNPLMKLSGESGSDD
jgi:hypothetical protein